MSCCHTQNWVVLPVFSTKSVYSNVEEHFYRIQIIRFALVQTVIRIESVVTAWIVCKLWTIVRSSILTFAIKDTGRKQKMDSDDGFSDYEPDQWDDLDSIPIARPPPFETLTADDIVKLMNQYIEHVIAIVKVSATSVGNRISSWNDEWWNSSKHYIYILDARHNHTNSFEPHQMGETRSVGQIDSGQL